MKTEEHLGACLRREEVGSEVLRGHGLKCDQIMKGRRSVFEILSLD